MDDKRYADNTQPKAAPATSSSASKPPSTPTPATAQTPAPPAAPLPASNPTSNPPATPTPAGPASTGNENESFNDPSALALGAQRDAAITNMESMGFPRTDIDRAMRAAFYNPDRAVEYLLNGIPENVQAEQRQGGGAAAAATGGGGAATAAYNPNPAAPAAGATAAAGAPATGGDGGDQPINLFEAAAQAGRGGSGARSGRAGGGAAAGAAGGAGAANLGSLGAGIGAAAGTQGGEGLGNLDFLRTNPQFQQLRQIVQTQPRMLEPILQQVGAGNPQLAALIGQNPDQFLQLLSEDAEGDAPLPPGAQEISVTEDEREAIERVSAPHHHPHPFSFPISLPSFKQVSLSGLNLVN